MGLLCRKANGFHAMEGNVLMEMFTGLGLWELWFDSWWMCIYDEVCMHACTYVHVWMYV